MEARGRVVRSHEFSSGTLRIGTVQGDQLVDGSVNVVSLETGQSVGGGRTYARVESNPKVIEVVPGDYRVTIQAIRLEGRPRRELELRVEAGEITAETVDFSQ